MGLIIWYQLGFLLNESLPPLLKVSNDMLSGAFTVDAEITTTARVGATVSSFEITLRDLPKPVAEQLKDRQRDNNLLLDIHLGYFEQPGKRKSVMRGRVADIHSKVEKGELLTVLIGHELAGFRLLHTPFVFHQAGPAPLQTILDAITKQTKVNILTGSEITGSRIDYTLANQGAMETVERLAADTKAAFAIRDGIVHMGSAVSTGAAAEFSSRTNLVKQSSREQQSTVDTEDAEGFIVPKVVESTTVHQFTVLGDPTLFLGQRVKIPSGAELIIVALTHKYLPSGFVTEVEAIAGPLRTRYPASGLEGFIDGLLDRIRAAIADRSAVRTGDVKSYGDGHRATLDLGQAGPLESTAPSTDATLHDKPLASPFAWDGVGLMLPVYPGMRAVLAHHGGEINDAVAVGYVWSQNAGHTPPPNEPGDYWLSLPTEVTNGRPSGKTANDLTDATGHRVIQSAGLAIDVGHKALPPIGTRPKELPADDTLVIRHGSETTITIDKNGGVSIVTKGQDLVLGNGTASITISGGDITLAGAKVDVKPHA
jgi:hypothetical protein